MFKQILFPVDFTGSSEPVVPYVRDLAEKYGAKVHVIHVIADVGGDLYVPGEAVISFINEIREGAESMMKEFLDQHFPGFSEVEGRILEGDPAEEIMAYARENNHGLIVMPTHGRKGLDRVVFGSVAENVVRSSAVPVLTVNPHLIEG